MEETHSTLPLSLNIAIKPGPTAWSSYVRTLKGKLWHTAWGMKSAFKATLSQWWDFHFFSLQYAVAWTQHSRLGSGHQDRTQGVFREATSFWPDTVKRELLTPKESMDISRFVFSFFSLFSHSSSQFCKCDRSDWEQVLTRTKALMEKNVSVSLAELQYQEGGENLYFSASVLPLLAPDIVNWSN